MSKPVSVMTNFHSDCIS